MQKIFSVISLLIVSLFTIIACSKDSSGGGGNGGGGGGATVDCNTVTNKSFAADVNPIIQSTCNQAGCHASGSTNGPGALTNHTQVAASASAVRSAIVSGNMPRNTTLSTAQKNSIICWIDSGAPNN